MAGRPDAHYARTANGTRIGYWTYGSGPVDVLSVSSFGMNLDVEWDVPAIRAWFERMAPFARVIHMNRRGTGISDRVPIAELAVVESWTEDVRAVLDDAESERAALIGFLEGGHAGMVFAASQPARVAQLVLISSWARLGMGDDYPIGLSDDVLDAFVTQMEKGWGTTAIEPLHDAHEWTDDTFRHDVARRQRVTASPSTVAGILRAGNAVDLREVLPLISQPTLVVHQSRGVVPRPVSRYLADRIPDARYVELDTAVMPSQADQVMLAETVLEFLTGQRPAPREDRVLATMLFTDLAHSTEHAARVGDRAWRDLLDRHDDAARQQLAAFRGREVKTTGDGFLALFDGPARAIHCAVAIKERLHMLGLVTRAGLHCGEVELRGDDVAGIAVHIAQRVSGLANPDEILVSRTVVDLVVGSELAFDDRGDHELKGVPGRWSLFGVRG